MDARAFGEVLTQSINLLESKEVDLNYIKDEFGIAKSVHVFTNLTQEDLTTFLQGIKAQPQEGRIIAPRSAIRRPYPAGRADLASLVSAPEATEYSEKLYKIAFPNANAATRNYLTKNYDSRFAFVATKDEAQIINYLRAIPQLITILADAGVNFIMPSAIGNNHRHAAGIYVPWFGVDSYSDPKVHYNLSPKPTLKTWNTDPLSVLDNPQACIKGPCPERLLCKQQGFCSKEYQRPDRYSSDDSHLR